MVWYLMTNLDSLNINSNSDVSLTDSVKASHTHDIYERFVTQASQDSFSLDYSDSSVIKQHASAELFSTADKHVLSVNKSTINNTDTAHDVQAVDNNVKAKPSKLVYLLFGLLLGAIIVYFIYTTGLLANLLGSTAVTPDDVVTAQPIESTPELIADANAVTALDNTSVEAASNTAKQSDTGSEKEVAKALVSNTVAPATLPKTSTPDNSKVESSTETNVESSAVSIADFENEASSTLYRETTDK